MNDQFPMTKAGRRLELVIGHLELGIHWSLVIGHWSFPPIPLLCTILLIAGSAPADPPAIKHMLPSAVAPGRTTEVTFVGNNLGGATNLWTSFDAKADRIRCTEDRAVFNVTVPAACATAFGAVQLTGTNGL